MSGCLKNVATIVVLLVSLVVFVTACIGFVISP